MRRLLSILGQLDEASLREVLASAELALVASPDVVYDLGRGVVN
jgi:hypothetical protein